MRRHTTRKTKSTGPLAKVTTYYYEKEKEVWLALNSYAEETEKSLSEAQVEATRLGLVALGKLPEPGPPEDDRVGRLEAELASFRRVFEEFMAKK